MTAPTTPEELEALIDKARNHTMTAEERFEQRVSFVYGQQDFDKPGKSKDEIRRVVAELDGYPLDEITALRAENERLREAVQSAYSRSAQVAYMICAANRHVTLGDSCFEAITALAKGE